LVFVRDIRSNKFGGKNPKYIDSLKFDELFAHHAKPGDILITKMGDPPGDVAVYPENQPVAVITSDCIKLNPNASLVCTQFVFYFLQSDLFRRKVFGISAGVAQQKVNLKKFRLLDIDVPELLEQQEIVRRVEELFALADRIEKQYQVAKTRVDKLTQSILAKAFRGELVPQDPNDEPAEQLLARIRAERAEQSKKTKPKPKRRKISSI